MVLKKSVGNAKEVSEYTCTNNFIVDIFLYKKRVKKGAHCVDNYQLQIQN